MTRDHLDGLKDLDSHAHRSWHWQDYVSSYRFWGIVLAHFCISCAGSLNLRTLSTLVLEWHDHTSLLQQLVRLPLYGEILGIIVVIYFLRRRIKLTLILFASLAAIAHLLTGVVTSVVTLSIIQLVIGIASRGFLITALAALVAGRPSIKTFIIAYGVLSFWQLLAILLVQAQLDLASTFGSSGIAWVAATLGSVAVLVLIFIDSRIFFGAPDTFFDHDRGKNRSPLLVFLLANFVPFYVLFWVYRWSREASSLVADARQPSGAGAICTVLFAPFLWPVWFHDVRHGMRELLPNRSAALIAVVSVLFPAIAVGMAQSDLNAIRERQKDSTL